MISLSYLCAFYPFGMTVLLVSDISDCLLDCGKFVRDCGIKKFHLLEVIFVTLVFVWNYTRILVLNFCVLKACVKASYMIFTGRLDYFPWPVSHVLSLKYGYYYQVKVFLIFLLCLLNVWWSYLLVRIAYNKILRKDVSYAIHAHGEKGKKGK